MVIGLDKESLDKGEEFVVSEVMAGWTCFL